MHKNKEDEEGGWFEENLFTLMAYTLMCLMVTLFLAFLFFVVREQIR